MQVAYVRSHPRSWSVELEKARKGGEAKEGCAIDLVTTNGSWGSVPLGTLSNCIECASDLPLQRTRGWDIHFTNSLSFLVYVTPPTSKVIKFRPFLGYFCARNFQSHEAEKQGHLACTWRSMLTARTGRVHHSYSPSHSWAGGCGTRHTPLITQLSKS